jgi:hypothetical protein
VQGIVAAQASTSRGAGTDISYVAPDNQPNLMPIKGVVNTSLNIQMLGKTVTHGSQNVNTITYRQNQLNYMHQSLFSPSIKILSNASNITFLEYSLPPILLLSQDVAEITGKHHSKNKGKNKTAIDGNP